MSFIKTNSDIADVSDLCGLISGAILRQNDPFSKELIFQIVRRNSERARCGASDDDLMAMIEARLDVYERNGDLQLRRGVYYPQTLEYYL